MRRVHRASVGYVLRHPLQATLALVGVVVGVAVMVAIDLANDSARRAFVHSMDTLNGSTTHQIVAGPGGIDETLYADLRRTPGMPPLAPVVEGHVRLSGEIHAVLGIDIFAERDFRTYTAPADVVSDLNRSQGAGSAESMVRQLLAGGDTVYLPAVTAYAQSLRAGDSVIVNTAGRALTMSVAGLYAGGTETAAGPLVADIGVVQRWFSMTGRLTRIDVRIANDTELGLLQDRLPAGVELLPAASRTRATLDMSNAFMTNLSAMSLLAMLVGVFLIFNSTSFMVLQRRELIATLRALGVTRNAIGRMIFAEAILLGITGALIGIVTGQFLGEQLVELVARTVSDHFFAVTVGATEVAISTYIKGFIVGVLAATASALVPAIEAASWAPRLAALRSVVEGDRSRISKKLLLIGAVLAGLAMALLYFSGSNLVSGLIALFSLILGFALFIPYLTRHAALHSADLADRIAGAPGRLAIGGVAATLSRTGVATVALAIAVSATVGVSVMVGSFRISVHDWLNDTLRADIYLGVPGGSLQPDVIEDLVNAEGVQAVSLSRRGWLDLADGRIRLIALDPAPEAYAGMAVRPGHVNDVWRVFDSGDGVLVSDSYAYRLSISPGDSINFNSRVARDPLAVAGIYQSYDANEGAVMMHRDLYRHLFDDHAVDSLGIYLEVGQDVETVMARLRSIAADRQAVMMSSTVDLRRMSMRIFDRTFVITNVLYWLAVLVAIVGIFGAMLALQLEKARDIGLLRALGMTPRQIGASVCAQSGFIGLVAGLSAVPLGLLMAWVLVRVINRRAFGWDIEFVMSGQPLVVAVTLSIGAALCGGVLPAWRAGRIPVGQAIRIE